MTRVSLLLVVVAVLALSVTGAVAAPGNLDSGFGNGGIVTTNFNDGDDIAYGVAVQNDANIVAAGQSETATVDLALARYLWKNGALDTSFGSKGKVRTDLGGDEELRGVVLRPAGEGGQVVGGGWTDVGGDNDFLIAQYTKAGKLDMNFGPGGWRRTDIGGSDQGRAIALRSDGKAIVVGSTDSSGGGDTALVRYLKNGKLDTGWGTGGIVVEDLSGAGTYDDQVAILFLPDGRFYTAGSGLVSDFDFIVARWNANGTLDTTFDGDGVQEIDFGGQDAAFALTLLGSDVIVGGTSDGDWAIASVDSDGNVNGTDTEDLGGSDDVINGLTTHNGLILAVGATNGGADYDFAVGRFDSGLTLDGSFGSGGTVITDVGGEDGGRAAAVKSGKLIAAGESTAKGTNDFALIRYSTGS